MNLITESFYKVLTIVYEQEGFDANNIKTIETINNYKCYHTYKGVWQPREGKQWVVCELSLIGG